MIDAQKIWSGPWHEDPESEILSWTVQPPYLGLVKGDYYHAGLRYSGRFGDPGHLGELDVVTDGKGKILHAEFNEKAMANYYVRCFQNLSKRRSDFQFFQDYHDRRRYVHYGVVLANGFKHVEDQILARQDLRANFDLLSGASFSLKSMLPLAKKIADMVEDRSAPPRRYYGVAEKFGYGITGWLQVVVDAGKIVSCFYDEIFADSSADIRYDELKKYCRLSKYYTPVYEDPFPSGWDRHAWLASFELMSDMLNRRVCERQDLFDIEGLPCVEGQDLGVVWDQPGKDDAAPLLTKSDATARAVPRPRSPIWNNYLRLAAVIDRELRTEGVEK